MNSILDPTPLPVQFVKGGLYMMAFSGLVLLLGIAGSLNLIKEPSSPVDLMFIILGVIGIIIGLVMYLIANSFIKK